MLTFAPKLVDDLFKSTTEKWCKYFFKQLNLLRKTTKLNCLNILMVQNILNVLDFHTKP